MFSDVEIQAKRVLESRTPEVQAQFDAEARAAYKAWFHNGGDGDDADSKLYWAWLDADARRSGRERAFRTNEEGKEEKGKVTQVEINLGDLVAIAVKANLPTWWEDELLQEDDAVQVSLATLAMLMKAGVYKEFWTAEQKAEVIKRIKAEVEFFCETQEQKEADAREAAKLNESLAGENAQARREGRGTVHFVTQQERDEEAKLSESETQDVVRERGNFGFMSEQDRIERNAAIDAERNQEGA